MIGFGAALMGLAKGLDRALGMVRPMRVPVSFGRPLRRPPRNWAAFEDPEGRFLLRHPREWKRESEPGGVLVWSPQIGTFVRVDAVESVQEYWRRLRSELSRTGARISVGLRTSQRARGECVGRGLRFAWETRFHRVCEGLLVVLSTGNVEDARRGRAFEAYEDAVLQGIRRFFEVGSVDGPRK
jgi:hypothetical protein